MEYNGIDYSVVRKINSQHWQWTVQMPSRKTLKIGTAVSREFAIRRAKVFIDSELKKQARAMQSSPFEVAR